MSLSLCSFIQFMSWCALSSHSHSSMVSCCHRSRFCSFYFFLSNPFFVLCFRSDNSFVPSDPNRLPPFAFQRMFVVIHLFHSKKHALCLLLPLIAFEIGSLHEVKGINEDDKSLSWLYTSDGLVEDTCMQSHSYVCILPTRFFPFLCLILSGDECVSIWQQQREKDACYPLPGSPLFFTHPSTSSTLFLKERTSHVEKWLWVQTPSCLPFFLGLVLPYLFLFFSFFDSLSTYTFRRQLYLYS